MSNRSKISQRTNRKSMLVNLSLILGGLILGLVLAEGLSRLLFLIPPQEPWLVTYEDKEGTKISLDKLSDYESIPRIHFYKPFANFTAIYKKSSWRPRLKIEYQMNNFGFRDEDFHLDHSPGVHRVALIGDSLGMGWGVPSTEVLDKKIEQGFKRKNSKPVEVYNFSVNAIDTEAELKILEKKVLPFNPDHIVVLWYLNDCACHFFDGLSHQETQTYNSKMKTFDGIPPGKSNRKTIFYRYSNLYRLASLKLNTLISSNDSNDIKRKKYWCSLNNPCYAKMFDAMEKTQNHARKRSIPFTVIMAPELVDLIDYPYTEQYLNIQKRFKDSGMDVVNILDFVKPYRSGHKFWVHPHDHHPNGKFYSIISEKIVDHFITQYPGLYANN